MFGNSERFEDYHGEVAGVAVGMAFALAGGVEKLVPAATHCQLLLARAGAVRVMAGDAMWIIGAGNALLLGVGVPASVLASSDCVVHAAHMPVRDGAWRRPMVRRVVPNDLVRALLSELVQVPAGKSSARIRRIARLLLEEIRLEETPPIRLPRPSDPRLLRACDAVLDDPTKAWDAHALARHAGMSTRTLARRFVQQVGVAPAQWCRSARLVTALTEVARGGTLHAAAAASGFAGPASLCAAFRQATGTTFTRYFRGCPSDMIGDEASFFS